MRFVSAHRVIATSFLVDISDVILSFLIALASGSVVMASQALEGAADLVSSGLLFYGFRKANQPADRTHPFGYGKELYFWTLMSALLMFMFTALASIYQGWERLLNPHPITNINIVYYVLIMTTLTNLYSFSLSFKRLLGKHNLGKILAIFYQSNLIETKTVFVMDLMGSLASVLSLIAMILYQITGDARFDGLGAILIGIVLAILAFSLIVEIKDLVIGISAPLETQLKIRQIAESVNKVNKVIDLRTMIIGNNKILVNLEVNLDDKLTTDEIELLVDKIKTEIKKEIGSAKYIQIELESPEGH